MSRRRASVLLAAMTAVGVIALTSTCAKLPLISSDGSPVFDSLAAFHERTWGGAEVALLLSIALIAIGARGQISRWAAFSCSAVFALTAGYLAWVAQLL